MKIILDKELWEEMLENIEFTDAETEIIPLYRRGWAQVDIAAELDISVSTVKRRVTSISNKIMCYVARTREPKLSLK